MNVCACGHFGTFHLGGGPCQTLGCNCHIFIPPLTVRDYFAMAASPVLCGTPEQIAAEAYRIADAMIIQRLK